MTKARNRSRYVNGRGKYQVDATAARSPDSSRGVVQLYRTPFSTGTLVRHLLTHVLTNTLELYSCMYRVYLYGA